MTTARLFDVNTGQDMRTWKVGKGEWAAFSLSPDGRTVAAGDDTGLIRLWDADTGRELARWQGHESAVTAMAFHPDGKALVTGGRDGTLKLWDLPYVRKELAALGLD
jgi:WD40 repeat protein